MEINHILKGDARNEWYGFDAGKITMIDSTVSIKEEMPLKVLSSSFSDNDTIDKINEALCGQKEEKERVESRLKEIARIKQIYDVKELESRKETCTPCNGNGAINCARCEGDGSVVVKESASCPTCSGEGKVQSYVCCRSCRGKGRIIPKCYSCNGKGRLRISHGGARLDTFEKCGSCNGSGRGSEEFCPRCSGEKRIEISQICQACKGSREVLKGHDETCPTCHGNGKLKCNRCGGRGFTYRPKQ